MQTTVRQLVRSRIVRQQMRVMRTLLEKTGVAKSFYAQDDNQVFHD